MEIGINYISSHTIRDDETNEHDLQDFQFVFIELPKFPKNKVEQLTSTVERWCFFFKYAEETTELMSMPLLSLLAFP